MNSQHLGYLVSTAIQALSPRDQRLFACRTARRALEARRAAGHEPHPECWKAGEVAERFAAGLSTADELRSAQRAANGDGNQGALWAAYRSAYWAADWAADWATERALQLIDLLGVLTR